MDKELFVWLNSYIFNQFKILAKDVVNFVIVK